MLAYAPAAIFATLAAFKLAHALCEPAGFARSAYGASSLLLLLASGITLALPPSL